VLGLDLTLAYDASVVEVMAVSATDRMSGFSLTTGAGAYRLSAFSAYPLETDGDLLVFDVALAEPGARGLPISIRSAEANEGQISVRVGAGRVSRAKQKARRGER
jgi:hypothetical protein